MEQLLNAEPDFLTGVAWRENRLKGRDYIAGIQLIFRNGTISPAFVAKGLSGNGQGWKEIQWGQGSGAAGKVKCLDGSNPGFGTGTDLPRNSFPSALVGLGSTP